MRPIILCALALAALASAAVPRTKQNVEASRALMQQVLAKRSYRANQQPAATPLGADKSKRIIVENFFTTRVDHFNPQNTDEWTLRYLAVTDFYMPGGPVLIRLGGAMPIQPYMVDDSSLIYEMAREMNGIVYAFETRFYGQSWVTGDVSTENLRLLNSDQILADLAEFVNYIKRDVLQNEYAHVLVAGEGLGGALATWFRVRYPHLCDAAWSSSGWQEARMDFMEFAEAWGQTLIDHGSQACYNEIFVAFHVMQNLIDLGLQEKIFDRFNICTPIDPEDRLQVQYFFSTLMTAVEMYTLRNGNLTDFSDVCDDLTGITVDTAVDAFANWFNTKFAEDIGCVVSDINIAVDAFSETDWNAAFVQLGARQMLYQECTEFGWFFTTDSDFQPFGNRVGLELYSETCRLVFGEWITYESIYYATQRANNRFGGLTPNVNRIHFTNGAEDPWREISITSDLNAEALADVIPGELSGSDMRAISEDDSEELRAVKLRLKDLLSYYLFPLGPRKMRKN